MSRSINGDNGNTGGVAITVMDQIETKQYVFDGELVLFEQTFVEPVRLKVDINLLYSWAEGCTRASRFYLHVGDAVFQCGIGDSLVCLNHIEKIVVVRVSDLKVCLKKDAAADSNDSIRILAFSFIKLTVL